MLTPIQLFHQLDRRRVVTARPSRTQRFSFLSTIRFPPILAIIGLGLGGLGYVETARAKSLGGGDTHHLQLATSNQSSPERSKIAQTNTPTPDSNSKLPNDLNLPKTGGEVQITGTRAITLQEALDLAFRNNRQVQASRLTVARSQASIGAAQAAQSVQVGLTSTLQNQGSPLIIGDRPQVGNSSNTDVQGNLQATYNVLSAGRNQSSVRVAEEQVRFDSLDLLRVEQLVRGQVITAYYDLQAADSAIIINQASVRDATRSLSDAQLQEQAGVGTRFDILRAQVQLATANQDLTNSQGQQQTARQRIAQLLVVDNNTQFTAADTVRESGTWNYSLEESVVIAFKNRPEVKQQLSLRLISQQQQIIASAADSAQVNLFARYGLGKSLTTSTSAQDNYSLGAQLSWNFLDGGAAGSNSNREKVSQQIFENQFTTTRNQIRFEVEQAYFSLGSSQKNIATSTQALRQAEESLKLARLRFQAGVGTQTDVIVAQTALATARGNRITAILNYNRALSSLRTATILAQ
ncbi:TolC family protein [Chamaesiphon sp.]|uniref:TolC family protein n=1 Tax=Chamaesiphon sp. TaxID=2814140 RepID=UPI0035947E17